MKHFSALTALAAALLLAGNARAQHTGSYDTTINFMGSPRAVSVYVPPTYNPANGYKLMIGLHGLGDTCTAYRDAVINARGWGAALPNTIFVFPESSSRNADYHEPAGSGNEAIIDESIAFARALYNIDTTDMVLQGFSLGGRAALRYGLNYPQKFKGLLLNTPAVQGVKEATNNSAYYPYNYANAPQVPIYIINGETDYLYVPPLDSVYEQLARNNGKIRHLLVPGMGHTLPAFSLMSDFQSFFNNPAHAGKDAEAVRLYTDKTNHCTAPVTAKLLVRNAGQDAITSVRYTLQNGTATQSATWTGNLPAFGHAEIPVTVTGLAAGGNAISVRIDSLNGAADTVTANNTAEATVYYQSTPDTSLNEGFEGANFPPDRWALEPSGDAYSVWADDNTVARTGQQSVGAFNTILIFDNLGRKEKLITPLVKVPTAQPVLQFDVAYNYHEYTPPYFTAVVDFADTLEVEYSVDCSATYQSLYKKGGSQLATFSSPIMNPLDINSCFINPGPTNWRTESISLAALSGTTPVNALFRFVYTSALGGSINIDNVAVRSTTAVADISGNNSFALYPNPATESVVLSGAAGKTVAIVNNLGQTVWTQQATSDLQTLNIAALPTGIYQVLISDTGAVVGRQRLVKN